ncbi:hypothetical protein MKX01_030896 [Papaver californicum]|nr:hypothetical protein MKX01_030896 [Papaver californicum]
MGTSSGDGKKLTPESMAIVAEGIFLILSRWTALQLALQYRVYDKFSCQRAEQLHADIFYWFTQSKELYIDDLERILEDSMGNSIDTYVDDESIGDVCMVFILLQFIVLLIFKCL